MSRLTRLIILALIAGLPTLAIAQVSLTVKLATIAPQNSIWHDALRQLGETWKATTDGRIGLTIYAGGTRGTEPSYIKMMGFDDIQASLMLPPGLSEIDDAFNVLGLPFFFESDAEARFVLDALTPTLTAKLEAKRFHLVSWGHAGWIRIFSKRPIRQLADMQKGNGRIYTTEGNDAMLRCYREVGFDPVAKTFNDIPAALKSPTGGLDIVPSPPLGAKTMFFRDARNMLELRVAPLISAIIMNDRTWNRISDTDRAAILKGAADMEAEIMAGVPALVAESIRDMQDRGLTITVLDDDAHEEFRAAATKLNECMRGTVVPADVYDEAVDARDEYRRTRHN